MSTRIKFTGDDSNFRVHSSNDSTYVNVNIPPQIESMIFEIDDITYGENGRVGIRGRSNVAELVIQRRDGVEVRAEVVNGQFDVDDLQSGIYSVFPSSNPSMRTDVVIALDDANLDDDNDPIYDIVKRQVIIFSSMKKTFPWNWNFTLHASESDPNFNYEIAMINGLVTSYVGTLASGETMVTVTDASTEELYHSEYDVWFRVLQPDGGYVDSNRFRLEF